MNLMRYEPNRFFSHFKKDIDKAFSKFDQWPNYFGEDENFSSSQWVPAVDVKEEEDRFVIRADVPGVDPKDIDVSMDNWHLVIKGERKQEDKVEGQGYTRLERSYGTFYRRFSLPETADAERISAKDEHGVLEITIGKRAGAEPRKIAIQS